MLRKFDALEGRVKTLAKEQKAMESSLSTRIDALEAIQKTYAEALRECNESLRESDAKSEAFRVESQEMSRKLDALSAQVAAENLTGLLVRTASAMGASLLPGDVRSALRLKGSVDSDKPRMVLLSLSSRALRDALLAVKRRQLVLKNEGQPLLYLKGRQVTKEEKRNMIDLLKFILFDQKTKIYYRRCMYPNCSLTSRSSMGTTTIHRFSVKDREKCITWLVNSGLDDWTERSNTEFQRKCNQHFLKSSFYMYCMFLENTAAKMFLCKGNSCDENCNINCNIKSTYFY